MATKKPKLVAAVGSVLLAGVAAVTLFGCSGETPKAATGAPGAGGPPAAGAPGGPGGPGRGRGGGPTEVVVAPVTMRPFALRIGALGTLAPRERVDVTADAAARVTGVYFEDGQRVKAGATLVILQQDEERALLESSQASQADAQRIYERNKRLSADGAVSAKDLDSSRALAESTAANVRSLQARIGKRVITAPFSGVLGFRKVSNGAFVSPGQVVATLIDDTEMRLEFGVPSLYGVQLKNGLTIRATTKDLPGKEFEGSLTSIDNAIDPVTRNVKVRATLPNRTGDLKAGMFMDVAVLTDTRNSLSIPEIAVIAEGEDTYAFVVEKGERPPGAGGAPGGPAGGGPRPGAPQQPAEGKPAGAAGAPSVAAAGAPGVPGGDRPFLVARKKPIKVGVRERGVVEVLSGLNEGDKVVTDGILKVRPNGPVRVKMPPKDGGEGGGEGGPRVAEGVAPVDKSSLRQ